MTTTTECQQLEKRNMCTAAPVSLSSLQFPCFCRTSSMEVCVWTSHVYRQNDQNNVLLLLLRRKWQECGRRYGKEGLLYTRTTGQIFSWWENVCHICLRGLRRRTVLTTLNLLTVTHFIHFTPENTLCFSMFLVHSLLKRPFGKKDSISKWQRQFVCPNV